MFCAMSFCFYYWFWTGKYRLGRLSKIEDLCDFQINSLSSSFYTFSIQSGVFFYISMYWGYYALQCHDFKEDMQEKEFQGQTSFYFHTISRHHFIKVMNATNVNFEPWLKLEMLKGGSKHIYACMHTIYTRKRACNRRVDKINQQKNCKCKSGKIRKQIQHPVTDLKI